jgi:hypothetical protein
LLAEKSPEWAELIAAWDSYDEPSATLRYWPETNSQNTASEQHRPRCRP